MGECQQCGKYVEDLYAVPGEYGKTLFVCDACAGDSGTDNRKK